MLAEMQNAKKLYPATYKIGGRGWETNPLLTETKSLGAMG
jgi:hypothetical protein